MYRIEGSVLPDGERREVFVRDGRFTFHDVPDAETLIEDGVLIPGLVDVHAHLALNSPAAEEASSGERIEASLTTHLDAGVLAVREPGGPDRLSADYSDDERFPRLQAAGRFLAPPGRYFPGLAREVVDDDVAEAAVEELRAGGGAWAKLIGDSPFPGPAMTRTFGREALAAAAEAVHDAGGRIAIHVTDPEVIQDAIDARFDSLEHGTFLQHDQIAAAVATGTAWVPTCSINDAIAQFVPDGEVAEFEQRLARQRDVLAAAAEAGLTVLAGTDAGMGPHGRVGDEIRLLADAGLGNGAALGAGSWVARRWLGLPGIEEGAPADLVVFREDPVEDLAVLSRPVLVLLGGRVVRRHS